MNYRCLFVLLWISCLLGGMLQAETRTCRIVYPERPQGSLTHGYLFDGKKSHRVTLPSMNFSEVIELPDGELLMHMATKEVSDPEKIPAQTSSMIVPMDVKDFYILITPAFTEMDMPIHMEMVETGNGKLNSGEIMWFNYTKHRITAKLAATDIIIDPSARIVSKKPMETSGYYEATFSFEENGEGAFRPITEQSWWHCENSKHVGFIFESDGKLPQIFYLRDFRIPKK